MFLAAVAIFTIFGVIVTIHWHLISCWKTFHFLQWSRDTLPHFAASEQSPWSSTSRSQVRRTLKLNRLLFGVLLTFLKMAFDSWANDEHQLLQIQTIDKIFSGGKDFSPTMGADGGSAFAMQSSLSLDDDPKQHGTWPTKRHSAVQKRSYKRACRRAIQDGCAWFHGKRIPLHEFPIALIETLKQTTTPHTPACSPVRSHGPVKPRSKPCITVLNWNPGGLGETRFAELKTWLKDTDFNVVILPETRWSFQNEWEDDHWCYFHSGDSGGSRRVSGVLVMVSKQLRRSHNMFWTTVIPGRLVHVRLMGLTRNIDIVACYQASTDTPFRFGTSKDVRAQVFQSLDELISTLPQRNVLLVAGDFNCSLQTVPGCCGTQTYKWNGHICPNVAYADSGTFAQILAQHHLIALNTWNGWNGCDGPTFVHQHFQRRIDFILCRKSSVDKRALDVKQLWHFPMLPLTGYHVPLACQLSRYWRQADAAAPARRFTMRQRLQCRQWHCSQSSHWQQFQQQLQHDLLDSAETAQSTDVISKLHNKVSSSFQEFWENQSLHLSTAGRGEQVDDTARSLTYQKWHHWKQCKRLTLNTVRGLFDGWYHATRFLSWKRLLQRNFDSGNNRDLLTCYKKHRRPRRTMIWANCTDSLIVFHPNNRGSKSD